MAVLEELYTVQRKLRSQRLESWSSRMWRRSALHSIVTWSWFPSGLNANVTIDWKINLSKFRLLRREAGLLGSPLCVYLSTFEPVWYGHSVSGGLWQVSQPVRGAQDSEIVLACVSKLWEI